MANTLKGKLAEIVAKVDNLPTDPADASDIASLISALDTLIDSILEDTGTTLPATLSGLDTLIDGAITKIDTIDGIVDDIKAALSTGIVTGNIKAGVTILGVEGKTEVIS